jgi:hypothetical protein
LDCNPGARRVELRTLLPSRGRRRRVWYVVLTSGVETLAMGNWPGAMEPERSRFCAVGSIAMEVRPGPGMKVEKSRPSAAGVSLVRKPEVGLRISGTRAESVG